MNADQFIAARVLPETKERFATMAQHQGLSESTLLKRMIELSLQSAHVGADPAPLAAEPLRVRTTRLTIRLRPDDELMLRERAAARSMAPATYVSVLTRAHLRSLAPLPKEELLALRRTTAQLASIGRNLNQIARAANQGQGAHLPGREDLKAMLKICEALRDHVRSLLSANLKSWEQGYAERVA